MEKDLAHTHTHNKKDLTFYLIIRLHVRDLINFVKKLVNILLAHPFPA